MTWEDVLERAGRLVPAYLTPEGDRRVWCDRCDHWHYDGVGGRMPAPDCDRPAYLLDFIGLWPDDVPHGTVQRATATPRGRCEPCRTAMRRRAK